MLASHIHVTCVIKRSVISGNYGFTKKNIIEEEICTWKCDYFVIFLLVIDTVLYTCMMSDMVLSVLFLQVFQLDYKARQYQMELDV